MPDTPPSLPAYRAGSNVNIEEIRDLLMDDGYSVDARKDWLKSLLTGLSQDEARSDEERSQLSEKISALVRADGQDQSRES